MKFIKQYLEEKYFLQTTGRVTLRHICDDAGLDGVKVCINNVETGLFVSQAEYDEWVESMFDEMIKSKNNEKLTDKIAPRFKVGDWIVGSNSVYKVVSLNDELSCYMVIDVNNEKIKIPYYFDCGPNHMCSYHLWTIRDARDGDVLVYQNGDTEIIMIFKSERDAFHAYTHFQVFNNTYEVNNSCVWCIGGHPATKEQCAFLFQKMKEAGYEWDADKKELKKIEQKPAEKAKPKFKTDDCVKNNLDIRDLDLKTWKYVVDSVLYQEHSTGVYINDERTETIAKHLQKRFGNIPNRQMIAKGERKNIALSIINYLDDNRVEGYMDLSSMECEDIEDACVNSKWTKLYNYMKKKLEKQDTPKDYNSIDPHFGKPIDNIKPKFKVGDYVVGEYVSGYISEVMDDCYLLDGQGFSIDKQDAYHLWTIHDAKDGDVLVSPRQIGCEKEEDIFIFKCIGNRDYVDNCIEYYCNIDEGEFFVNKTSYMGTISSPLYPATHEQREFLFKKMKEAGYKWDSQKKQILRIDNSINTIEKQS